MRELLSIRLIAPLLAPALVGTVGLADITDPQNVCVGGTTVSVPHEGAAFSAEQKETLEEILTRMEAAGDVNDQDLKKCAKCLRKMLKKDRLCREDSAEANKRWWATTVNSVPFIFADKCSPGSEMMNFDPAFLDLPNSVAASILAHEWSHTIGFDEADAYNFQKRVIVKLGTVPGGWHDIICKQAEDARLLGQGGAGRAPKKGHHRHFSALDDSVYFTHYSESSLFHSVGDAPLMETSLAPFGIHRPTGMLPLDRFGPNGGEVIAVSGVTDPLLDDMGTDGVVVVFEVADGEVLSTMAEIPVADMHPTSLAFLDASNTLIALDTLSSRMLKFTDTDKDGTPETFDGVFVDAAVFPDIVNVLSISVSVNESIEDDDVILAYQHDGRVGGTEEVTDDNLNAAMYAVRQNVFLGTVLLGEAIAFNAGFVTTPFHSADELEVSGTLNSLVQIRITDDTGQADGKILGSATIGDTYQTAIVLTKSLTAGEFVKVEDLTLGKLGFPVQFDEVQPDCNRNGVGDGEDIDDGTSTDKDGNGIPDECEGGCTGDVDGDGLVNGTDLILLLGSWGTDNADADLDGSGDVGTSDLIILLGAWGPCG